MKKNRKSIYSNLKSRVKLNDRVSGDFTSCLVVRPGECLFPILFSIYLNDIERQYIPKFTKEIYIGMLKVFLLLYAGDIILFYDKENLQMSQ